MVQIVQPDQHHLVLMLQVLLKHVLILKKTYQILLVYSPLCQTKQEQVLQYLEQLQHLLHLSQPLLLLLLLSLPLAVYGWWSQIRMGLDDERFSLQP